MSGNVLLVGKSEKHRDSAQIGNISHIREIAFMNRGNFYWFGVATGTLFSRSETMS